jgi:dTMP kinase
MFIVFEGIDGGGKTTLSNLIARALAESGLSVEHVRGEGRYASPIAQSLREFTRDSRNLALSPETELLLFAAREAQLFAEVTRPALARADVVIADRFFYTPEVLSCHARGLERGRVRSLLQAASAGVQPDLVFLVDVDPHIARARRRISKIRAIGAGPEKPPSRKGLSGAGLQKLLREGYLAMAAEDPARWLVVENDDESLEMVAERLTAWALIAAHHGVDAARRGAQSMSTRPRRPAAIRSEREAAARLLEWVDRRALSEPALAAWFLSGLSGPAIDARRRVLAPIVPEIVAEGLAGLDDTVSWDLREVLADAAPFQVARSLRGRAANGPLARALQYRLASKAPEQVLDSLSGRDDADAWTLRTLLRDAAPVRMVASLSGIDGERAWRWRSHLRSAAADDAASWDALCESVRGLEGDEAWKIRESAFAHTPVEAINSLIGLTSERSWVIRERLAMQAPRPVMRTLHASDDPRAWTLRRALAARCKETIDSISGMDVENAWEMRLQMADRWPSTVVKSLGLLSSTDRGRALVARQLTAHPGDLSLLKHVSSSSLAASAFSAAASP